jgi:hypothetical protein
MDKQSRKRYLARQLEVGPFALVWRAEKPVSDMSDDEVNDFVGKVSRTLLLIVALFVAWSIYLESRPESAKPPDPVAIFGNVEQVKDIQVHHTAFTEDSTVVTDKSLYQVKGAVSADNEATARLRRYENGRGASHEPSLCIQTMDAEKCYKLD